VALIVRALYGLKSRGAAWHAYFTQSLTDLGFVSCKSDPDAWRRPATNVTGNKYYEYILVYVDELLIVSESPQDILDKLADEHKYRLKDVGSPKRFLRANIGKRTIEGQEYWYIAAEDSLNKALATVEERFGKLDMIFKHTVETPAPTNFHPEMDDSDFLDDNGTTLYQSYIGIIHWAIELGRVDLAHFGSTMAKFSVAPRAGHLATVVRGFAYIKRHLQSKILIVPRIRPWDHLDWTSKYWCRFYPDINGEVLPYDMPPSRGRQVQINFFCDAAHATDLVTRRSTTGIIFFLNGTLIMWYAKRQNMIESSTFGSEFVALKIAAEMNDAL
jgi:hypothetical protein